MEKINVAKILKDCPQGMELDCTIWNNVTLGRIDSGSSYPIEIKIKGDKTTVEHLTKFGEWDTNENSKCVIFPKSKTTWEGFVPPCKYKDGDVVVTTLGNIAIIKEPSGREYSTPVLMFRSGNIRISDITVCAYRFATEEEKQKLFDAIKGKGYNWNEETKTLEKLITPTFKVGDTVKNKENHTLVIVRVTDDYYTYINQKGERGILYIRAQNDWELVPDNLIPFESKVLVRGADGALWKPAIYGCFSHKGIYVVGGIHWTQCIPYEGNEHLLGTTNDCDEYYKTWEKKA